MIRPFPCLFLNQCLIQDLVLQKKIGSFPTIRGLYLLPHTFSIHPSMSNVPTPPSVIAVSLNLQPQDIDVWHCRLGHPSLPRLQLVHHTDSNVTLPTQSHCSTCHLAKQKTLPYSRSMSRAAKSFELVHMDIWGPLNTFSQWIFLFSHHC